MQLAVDNLIVRHELDKRRFVIDLGDGQAMINYKVSESRIIFLYAGVPEKYEGKGIAARLSREALEYAKAKNYRVVSLCSYISRFIERHHEYQPMLDLFE
jgi:predicted GNAT family acetyltransferase